MFYFGNSLAFFRLQNSLQTLTTYIYCTGYVACLLQSLPLAKYYSFRIIAWGLVLYSMSAVPNFPAAVAVRFFQGGFGVAATPGFAVFTSKWCTAKERRKGTRTSIWFSFNGFGQILGGLVAYGITKGSRLHGSKIAPWKPLFITTGLLTSAMGLLFLLFIPDNQLNANYLSKSDRVLAIESVRANQQGIGNKKFKMKQLNEA